jgi:hypothetical protein
VLRAFELDTFEVIIARSEKTFEKSGQNAQDKVPKHDLCGAAFDPIQVPIWYHCEPLDDCLKQKDQTEGCVIEDARDNDTYMTEHHRAAPGKDGKECDGNDYDVAYDATQ